MIKPIYITAVSSISALGRSSKKILKAYLDDNHRIVKKNISGEDTFVASISEKDRIKIEQLKKADLKYKNLDDSVLFAILVSRKAIKKAKWRKTDNFGVNFGSSRGATKLFEKYHMEFLKNNVSSTLSSPTTTLGNISSWVSHDLQTNGPEISHSITCSTSLHSLLNGIAWLNSGMCNKFLVGGSEAPLTDFTIAQMKALKIYSNEKDIYPCRSLDLTKKRNTMVLGEGASAICLDIEKNSKAMAKITGIGYATEILKHNTSVSENAICFQKSIKMALQEINPSKIDAIILHSPGTKKGDYSEVNAIKKVFGENIPFLTTNKWKLGHTFGASGLLSLEMAILMIKNQLLINVPFIEKQNMPKKINNIIVNAVGFGGNAVSVLISK